MINDWQKRALCISLMHYTKQDIMIYVWGFTPYQKYFSYITATVYKYMFPGTILN